MPQITFENNGTSIQVPSGTLLIDAIRSAGYPIDAPCGGHGKCGKCKVLILDGSDPGEHKSCSFSVTETITVRLPDACVNRILESSPFTASVTGSNLTFITADIPAPKIGDSDSVCRRVRRVLGDQIHIPLSVADTLLQTLEQYDFHAEFVIFQNQLIAVRKEHATAYVLAYDIGTTTIVSYLLNAETGETVCTSSLLNPQTAYGGDVISRCEYDISHEDRALTFCVRTALQELLNENINKSGIAPEEIFFAVLCGNTCMQHLFLKVSTKSLLTSPYLAAVNELQILNAADYGLSICPAASLAVLPCIAGFVGGDTVGVLLSLPEHTFDRLTLILDIGTNGELVLGHGDHRITCSTAAGPAFEGAKISCGMRGADGAIDHVTTKDGALIFHTIGSLPPEGLCGSGLLDLVSCLLNLHILSERGRFEKPEKWNPISRNLYESRLVKKDGVSAMLLTDDENGIYLSQKDVRELQLAKAAIRTGIELLCDKMQVSVSDIESVLLAGAFGNYLDPASACRIGMIPPALQDKITPIGNAAGEGAVAAALNRPVLERAGSMAEETEFLELAVSDLFQNTYLSHLNFE